MNKLKSYLAENGEKLTAFAVRVGTTPSTISRLCSGVLKPSLDLAHSIEAATGGAVPTETWVDGQEGGENPPAQAAE